MTDQAMRATVDRLSRTSADIRGRLQRDGSEGQSALALVGYRFQPRQRVIDLATGNRVTVESGRRAESTGRAVYIIKTPAGEFVHRDELELAEDQAPVPAPEGGAR